MNINLIKCSACTAEISSLTDSCPQCGHPNSWVHPVIQGFYSNVPTIERDYTYSKTRTLLEGKLVKKLPKWKEVATILTLSAIAFFPIIFALSQGQLLRALIFAGLTGIAINIVNGVLKRKQKEIYFRYNAQANAWESNDEELFAPVRARLSEVVTELSS